MVPTLLVVGFLTSTTVFGQEAAPADSPGKFYAKPYGGFIGLQDMNIRYVADGQSADLSVNTGFGFTNGISFGYAFTERISAEFGWEYKANTITVNYNDEKITGDYASNFAYLSAFYTLSSSGRFRPYVGAGAVVIPEIDMDFRIGDENSSFSNTGNIGFQGLAGLDFQFARRWAMNWEAKYVAFQNFDMKNESHSTSLENLRYRPFIFNIGLKYMF
jgi:outer membrane protein W